MRGCVDPWEKSVIVPGLSVFLKRAWDSIFPWWRCPYVRAQPISGKPTWLGFHAVWSGVDTGGHRYCSRVFGAVRIRGIYESVMEPSLPRVRRKCPASIRLGQRCGARTNQRLANGIGVSSPCGAVSIRESSFFFTG